MTITKLKISTWLTTMGQTHAWLLPLVLLLCVCPLVLGFRGFTSLNLPFSRSNILAKAGQSKIEPHPLSRLSASASSRVALTREVGSNTKLLELLQGVDCVELPCLSFVPREEASRLAVEMTLHDFTVLTSPHAASVFIEAWIAASKPPVRVLTIGSGTSSPLRQVGLDPEYECSRSQPTAAALVEDLPVSIYAGCTVLYPTSSLSDDTLQTGLESKGLIVTRLSVYTSTAPEWSVEQYALAKTCTIAALSAPSAARAWVDRVGTSATAVAVGPTTAAAARELAFSRVVEPTATATPTPTADADATSETYGGLDAGDGAGVNSLQVWADLIRETAFN
jgi:uroporphyrinogen-III synthase